jgi:hypothetical protein
MAVKLTDEEINEIVDKYQNGMSVKELGKIFGVHYQTISNKLKQLGVFSPKTHNWTDADTEKLLKVYPSGDWDLILETFPNRTRTFLYCKASKLNIRSDNYFWTEHDKNVLINSYGDFDVKEIQKMLNREYTIRQIQNQAKKMCLTQQREWSDEEITILINHYADEGSDGVKKLLPYKSNRAIIGKAMKLGIACNCFWRDNEIKFLIDNWPQLSDEEIAKELGRGVKGVSDKRRSLGLYFPKNDISYYNIDDFIRHRNYEWKKDSMRNCNYKCVITGSSDFEVHHTYSFNLILKEAMLDNGWINKNFDDYTIDELNYNLNIFLQYQSKYPLGVCLSTDMHKKFHSIYGNRVNTPEQWEEFFNIHIHQ